MAVDMIRATNDEDEVWITTSMVPHVRYKFDNPHLNYGFILDQLRDGSDQPASGEARFHSNNSETRTASSLGKGPALFVKLKVPVGFRVSDVDIPSPAEPRDQLFGGPAAMVRLFVGREDEEPSWWWLQ